MTESFCENIYIVLGRIARSMDDVTHEADISFGRKVRTNGMDNAIARMIREGLVKKGSSEHCRWVVTAKGEKLLEVIHKARPRFPNEIKEIVSGFLEQNA